MPVYIRILKPSKTATMAPTVPQISLKDARLPQKCHNCPNSDTICLKMVQILPLIFLTVPQIALIVPPIVRNVPQKC